MLASEAKLGWRWHHVAMTASSTPGRNFEDYIAYIYQALLSCESQNIEVRRRAQIPDSRGNHYEIDVYYEFDLAGVRHRVALECKDQRRPIGRNDVLAFYAKIQEMPSTIGIFVSSSGFQSGAQAFLREKGILHYDSQTAPSMMDAVAAILVAAALPSEASIGQPFWGLMEERDGEGTGSWYMLPPGALHRRSPAVLTLFFSKPDALLFRQLTGGYAEQACIRGVPQTTLRTMLLISAGDGTEFAVMRSTARRGRTVFLTERPSVRELAAQYLPEGTARFDMHRASRSGGS